MPAKSVETPLGTSIISEPINGRDCTASVTILPRNWSAVGSVTHGCQRSAKSFDSVLAKRKRLPFAGS